MKKEIKGIITAVVTPFNSDDNIDEGSFRTIIRYLIDQGVHGLFPVGSQGEFFSLRMDERKRLMEIAVEEADGKVFVMPNTGDIATRDCIELTQHAEKIGADAVSMMTPFYINPSQEELYQHFKAVCSSVNIPILGYNNPERSGGVFLNLDTLVRLAEELPNFIGIKDSSGDMTMLGEIIRRLPPSFKVFVGRDSMIYAALAYGAAGAVAASSNVAAKMVLGIYDAVNNGEYEKAKELQRKLAPIRIAFGLGTFPVVMKEALNMLGQPAGQCRKPIQPMSEEAKAKLRKILTDSGIL
ncbi:4-hydroxy-tetrahydrodipicolinate synthase [candidate division KSB1 bacterium]